MKPTVYLISTGVANTASVIAGFKKLGLNAELTEEQSAVEHAGLVVLPGVGAFGAGMDMLRTKGLFEAIRRRVADGRPLLAVCLGLQLLFSESEEAPGREGLCLFPGQIKRFPSSVRVPQLGWNYIEADTDCRLLHSGYGYFANSYRALAAPEGWAAAYADHGGRFIAGMEKGPILCCQFHPELSSTWGLELLRRWIETALV